MPSLRSDSRILEYHVLASKLPLERCTLAKDSVLTYNITSLKPRIRRSLVGSSPSSRQRQLRHLLHSSCLDHPQLTTATARPLQPRSHSILIFSWAKLPQDGGTRSRRPRSRRGGIASYLAWAHFCCRCEFLVASDGDRGEVSQVYLACSRSSLRVPK